MESHVDLEYHEGLKSHVNLDYHEGMESLVDLEYHEGLKSHVNLEYHVDLENQQDSQDLLKTNKNLSLHFLNQLPLNLISSILFK